ncbi:hypothetical protein FACS189454_06780 [Planctomycetales bacterium]|nr:hypothetical protein FACS189454_06780 [Planctomycetales bacterium]
MTHTGFTSLAQSLLELDARLNAIEPLAETCGVSAPVNADWYALLKGKLIPQLNGGLSSLAMVIAAVGGTNTGKSLVFNHLADGAYSAVDYRASGTKHPVCLVPKSKTADFWQPLLERQFDGFELAGWHQPEQALELSEKHKLFWQECETIPDQLILLDTPDIDADRTVNWNRARAIRNAADVLIVVVTEQKYNDAAVRKFVQESAAAAKPVLLLFNMLDLPDDLEYLPGWVEQFCSETGTQPFAVIVAPHNKEDAANLSLTFSEWSPDTHQLAGCSLRDVLQRLPFATIKEQTLWGALKVLEDPKNGVRSYFDTIEKASNQFDAALKQLARLGTIQIEWTGLPTSILADEIRTWWNERRPNWAKYVNGVYRKVGTSLLWGIQHATSYIRGTQPHPDSASPLKDFQSAEKDAVISFIGKMMSQFERTAETDNPVLHREIAGLISGDQREKLLHRAMNILTAFEPVDTDFRQTLDRELTDWTAKNPGSAKTLSWLDAVQTVARPIITISLAGTGIGIGAHLLTDVVLAGVFTAGGEAALQAGSKGVQHSIAALFQRIQEEYVLDRSQRFYSAFQKELWDDVKKRLQKGADVADSETFKKCRAWEP